MKNKLALGLLCTAAIAGVWYYSIPPKNDNPVTQIEENTLIKEDPMIKINELRHEIITEAPGGAKKPEMGDMVRVHYTGWLNANDKPGSKFDSSVDRDEPFEFNVGHGYVIEGWDKSVIDMRVGEKRRVFIPASLGYGSHGAGDIIPPHADLIFDIELIEIL